MLKLKPQYFVHLMQRADSLEKSLIVGKMEGRRRRGSQRMRWHKSITEQTLGDGEGQEVLVCCSSWGSKELDMTRQLNNTLIILSLLIFEHGISLLFSSLSHLIRVLYFSLYTACTYTVIFTFNFLCKCKS